MKKSLLALFISTTFMLSACDDQVSQKLLETEKQVVQLTTDYKKAQDALALKEKELESIKSEFELLKAEAQKAQSFPALQVEIVPLFSKEGVVKHKKDPQDEYSPEESRISVFASTAKTGVKWLDQLVLQQLFQGEDSKAVLTEEAARQKLNAMYLNSESAAKEDKVIGYSDSMSTYYLGQRNNIVTFTQLFHSYSGGAHGIYHTEYLNVDINKKSLIKLDDLVSKKNQPKLQESLWESYKSSRIDENGQADLFTDKKDFYIADNFYFTERGITFVYPPYALGSFAEGEIELEVDYDSLKEIMNKDYFPTKKDGFGLDTTEY